MSKLNRARKREIREAVRSIVACEIRNMDFKNFDDIGENDEENAYIRKEVEEIAGRVNYKAAEVEAE